MPFNSVELVRASQLGDLDRVRTLVDTGADLNSIGEHGIGPLLTRSAKVMEFLLARGADPNLQTNESGDPVLVGIAYLNELDCVRLLLQAGANPNALVNGTDETALHAALAIPKEGAASAIQCALVQLLVEHGAGVNRQTRPEFHVWLFGAMCGHAARRRCTEPLLLLQRRQSDSSSMPAQTELYAM